MKTRYLGFLFATIALISGCSEEEIANIEQVGQPVEVMVQAYSGSDNAPVSRLAYTDSKVEGEGVTVTWSAEDAFFLRGETDESGSYAYGEMKIVEKDTYGKIEEFKGTLSQSLQKGENVTGYYPSAAYDDANNCFNVDVRKATQNKNTPMAHLSSMNYMEGKGVVNDDGLVTIDFERGNKVAIVRFDMKLPDNVTSDIVISDFLVESKNLHTIGTLSSVDYSFTENTFTEKHRQKVYLEGYTTTEKELSVYIAMLPTTLNEEMKVKLTLANGNVYYKTVSFSDVKVVACNRYYIVKNLESLIELDYKWYTSLGADAANYEIENENELYALARIVNGTAPNIAKDDFAGQTITLQSDITLSADWTPIGISETDGKNHSYFKGIFDGSNHTINDLKLYVELPVFTTVSRYFRFGFFGNTDGATIKDLTLRGDALMEHYVDSKYGTFNLGGLVGRADNTNIENCRNELDLMAYNLGELSMGGLVGSLYSSSVKVCSNAGDIVAKSVNTPYLGGVIGKGESDIVVACHTEDVKMETTNTGSTSYLGGIAGSLLSISKLVGLYSLIDEMKSDAKTKRAGGLAPYIGSEGLNSGGFVYGCYAITNLWYSSKNFKHEGNVSVGTEMNSETHMETLNKGIAAWNATLSGILDPTYCHYSYKLGDTHLVLEKLKNNNTGELGDMNNGGEIGKDVQ